MLCGLLPSQIGVVENKTYFFYPNLNNKEKRNMNHLILRPIITNEEKSAFIKEIQEAFQKSYENEFGEFEKRFSPSRILKNHLIQKVQNPILQR